MKTCRACAETKPLTEFYRRGKSGAPYLDCKKCHGNRTREWMAEHPDKVREIRRKAQDKYQVVHKEKLREMAKEKYWANPEKHRRVVREYYNTEQGRRAKSDQAARERERLASWYVKRTIIGTDGVSARLIPEELVEVKRQQLQLVRLLRDLKEVVSSKQESSNGD
jgi:hypothetical protein